MQKIIVRWQSWSREDMEHLELKYEKTGIKADSVLTGTACNERFAARYQMSCLPDWTMQNVIVETIGKAGILELSSDGSGNWTDASQNSLPKLEGVIDIDISATPFTNSLPIRRLNMLDRESTDIAVAYVSLPELSVSIEQQRYTCIEKGRRYRFESLNGDFSRILEIDRNGLVIIYPGLFRRLL